MALPREPRQKMINMMYLVLTALLALNVSSEILNAFKTVNRSLENTNNTVSLSTDAIAKSLMDKQSDPSTAEKAKIWYPKAQMAMQLSKDAYDYIQVLKNEILTGAGGDPNNSEKKFKEDDLEIATRTMISKGKGQDLLKKLTDYKNNILNKVDPSIATAFSKSISLDLSIPPSKNKAAKTWEGAYFHMVPTVAALTILSKFQNDVKTTENKIVAYCHEQVGKVEIRFDTYEAIVGQNSKYFMPGQEIEITAGLGAFSKQKLPTVSIGGSNVTLNEKGMAIYKSQAGGLGAHSIPVTVRFTDIDNKPQERTFNVEYVVGQSNASIALDKMNVLYIGVDNPVTIAASGGGDDKVQVSMAGGGGSINKIASGRYIVRVNSVTDDAKISVMVDGKLAGQSIFRVRTIPAPVATVGGVASNENMNAGQFRAQTGVGAYIKDFPFELQYKVVSFTLTADNADGDIEEAPCQGNTWSPKAQQIIRGLTGGRTVTVDQIRALGPDGRTVKVPGLTYYIK